MVLLMLAILATNVGNLRGDDVSKLSQRSLEVLLALDAELWGEESRDDKGNVLKVCIDRANGERLEKLVRTFPKIKLIYFRNMNESLEPEDLRHLAGLPNLTSIWFLSPLTDHWAEALSRFPKLQELYLIVRLGVTERGLSALSALKEVETLSLNIGYEKFHAGEDELGAAVLRQFPKVKTLRVSGASTSREMLREFGHHPHLRVLHCGSSQAKLNEDDYAPLAQLSHLEEAVLPAAAAPSIASLVTLKRVEGFTDIKDEGLRHFSGLRNLEEVTIASKHLTDQSLIHLKGAAALTTLHLRCPKISGSGLDYLSGCKQLRRLVLRQTKFQPQNVRYVTVLSALEYLDLGWTPMSDGENWRSLVSLQVLKNLKEVEIELSESDRQQLEKMLPGVSVTYLE